MRRMNKGLAALLALLLMVSIFATACGADKDKPTSGQKQNPAGQAAFPLKTDSKKVIAEYNGGKVTEGEFNLYLNILGFFQPQVSMMIQMPGMKQEIAKQYIGEMMVARQVGDSAEFQKQADESLKKMEEQVKQSLGNSKESFDQILKKAGFTKPQLKAFLIRGEKVSSYFEKQIKPDQLKAEYDKSDQFYTVKANHILISVQDGKRSDADAKKRALEVKQKLEKGGDFAQLAKQYSDDPGSKNTGGLIEGKPGDFAPEFANAVKTLALNKISDPVKTMYGYHIIKVTERKKQPFDQVKDEVKQMLLEKMYKEYLAKNVKVSKWNLPKEPQPTLPGSGTTGGQGQPAAPSQ
ncbi:hypothetical protein JIR001_00720 [Polycladomyces abyssicola]|jgi:foldase protein PrsA|uniref:PpiC domain-containing protein n=1 Tax=Polycladomyces abyssicola TaxID=1125966 RepID=A0A8D5UDE1_9BACL|nr:peptidylprolyl isomerase [Polycladomyces abyssicola]BCU80289.1 hypothetical protein JIR001_00720 [Polycladomyces abyssicola]